MLGLVAYGATLDFHVGNLHNALLALTFAGVGLYVLVARPGQRLGQLFVGLGVASALMYFGRQAGLHSPALPGGAWLAWVSIWLVPLSMAAAGVGIMVFPTGVHLSWRWRAASRAMVGLATLVALASALWPIEDDWRRSHLVFPFDLGGQDAARAMSAADAQLLLRLPGSCGPRRSSPGCAGPAATRSASCGGSCPPWPCRCCSCSSGRSSGARRSPALLTLPLVPLAAGVAIVRYRLYDIDPIINKALVGGAMVLLISVGYVGLVVGAGALLPVSDRVLALAATAAVAVVFEPVRRRAQGLADRLVYGRRATPYETLSRLSAQLSRNDEGLLEGLAATIAGGIGASEVVVWLGDAERMEAVAAWPTRAPADPRPLAELGGRTELVRPVAHDGIVQGALVLTMSPGEPLTSGQDQLLDDLVAQTGLVIDHRARLEEVARQAAELQAAARRIVTAEDSARRRIERDLHDGAQQRLVSLGMELGALVERAAATGDPDMVRQADTPDDSCWRRPPSCARWPGGCTRPCSRRTDSRPPWPTSPTDHPSSCGCTSRSTGGRRPRSRQPSTSWSARRSPMPHATQARSAVEVDVSLDMDRLTVEVSDDGTGGAKLESGGGLQGLADRLSVLGARLEVVSPPGGGTTVRTVLACG